MVPMRPEIERLSKQADHARRYEIAAFLAEQAVEKYLDRRRSTSIGADRENRVVILTGTRHGRYFLLTGQTLADVATRL